MKKVKLLAIIIASILVLSVFAASMPAAFAGAPVAANADGGVVKDGRPVKIV